MAVNSELAEILKYRGSNLSPKTNNRTEKTFEEYDRINWVTTTVVILSHAVAFYTVTKILTGHISWKLLLFSFSSVQIIIISTVAGNHRLWSHRAYKATLPLRIFFMIFSTMSFQGPIHLWARWHRQHHKFSDTAGDPHNPTRGFFFAHIGWFCMYNHQMFLNNSRNNIVTEDLDRDEVVMWQLRNYYWLGPMSTLVPTLIIWLLGWDHIHNTLLMTILCITYGFHTTGLINSVAHSSWGSKPYDKYLVPSRINVINILISGEGDHNYHHTFPWDYMSADKATIWNTPKYFIEFLNWIGLAYDLRSASPELIAQRAKRTGDGSLHKE